MSEPAPSPAERWIDCGHNECRSRGNAASDWPCIFAGKYEDSVGRLPHTPQPEAAGEFWTTVDGKVILEQENEIAALRAAPKKAEEENERGRRDERAALRERNAAEAREARVETLESIIANAPHDEGCSWRADSTMFDCDCWKAAALKETP